MSKRSSLDLAVPKLLKDRIEEYGIPSAPGQANYEKVLIFQIPDREVAGEKWSSTSALYKPDTISSRDKERCPRGIIVSAGLKALDILHDHGMQLGEMVLFSPHSFNRFEVGRDKDGKMLAFAFMHVSDGSIVSEDIPGRLMSGELELAYKNGSFRYVWKGEKSSGARRDPEEFDDSI